MMIKCDICGNEFDFKDANLSECACTCGEPRPKCPECGIDIILPPEIEEQELKRQKEESIFTKMEQKLE